MPHSTTSSVDSVLSTSKPLGAQIKLPQGSSWPAHIAKNVGLILVSLFFLPLDTGLLFLAYFLGFITGASPKRRRIRSSPTFYPKTILVTGVGMNKGLHLARMFHEAGHDVVGADFEPNNIPVMARLSRALHKFYRLTPPDPSTGASAYIHNLLSIVRREKIDLWVSCSDVVSQLDDARAKELIERRTPCKAIQLDAPLVETLHPKDSFITHVASYGLTVPETHLVTSRGAVHKILNSTAVEEKQYILKKVGIDDSPRQGQTVLPRPSMSETYSFVSSLDISAATPWVLQQYLAGEEYCTHALVVQGEVKAFVACGPSSDIAMHYQPLAPSSALSRVMLSFTQDYAARANYSLTGHLSFDFMTDERTTARGVQKTVYPIECNPRTHTAVVCFDPRRTGPAMVDAYLSALADPVDNLRNGHAAPDHQAVGVVVPTDLRGRYWIGHDLVQFVLLPLLRFVTAAATLKDLLESAAVFVRHLLCWRDALFLLWDPLPEWWLYHVYWPARFALSILSGTRWSRMNVSTVKMFTY